MHPESRNIRLVTLNGRERTDKPVCGLRDGYRGGQSTLSCSGVLENKNISDNFLVTKQSFWVWVSGRRDCSETWIANSNASVVLHCVAPMESTFVWLVTFEYFMLTRWWKSKEALQFIDELMQYLNLLADGKNNHDNQSIRGSLWMRSII